MQRWGWGEDMERTDASEESLSPVVAFFTDEETKFSLIIFGIALLLITSRVYYSLAIKDSEAAWIESVRSSPDLATTVCCMSSCKSARAAA